MNGLHEAQVSPITLPLLRRFHEGLARPSRHFERPGLYASGAGGRKTRRGVFRTLPHATRDKPPAMGGLTTPYRSHLVKRSGVCYASEKEGDYVVLHLHALQQVRHVLDQGRRGMQKLRDGGTRGSGGVPGMRGHLPCAEGHQARRDYIRAKSSSTASMSSWREWMPSFAYTFFT